MKKIILVLLAFALMAFRMPGCTPLTDVSFIERVCIPMDTADKRIGHYHHYLRLREEHVKQPLSFMIDAKALRQYLVGRHGRGRFG